MSSDSKKYTVAVVLAEDTLNARKHIEDIVSGLNNEYGADYDLQFEIIDWCEEKNARGEQTEWSSSFNFETPTFLIEKVREQYDPDIILCVFWKSFGSNSIYNESNQKEAIKNARQQYKNFNKEWKNPDYPSIRIFFSERATNISDEERLKKEFVSSFRNELSNDRKKIWFPYKQKNLTRFNELQDEIKAELENIAGINSTIQEIEYDPKILPELHLSEGWTHLNLWLKENIGLLNRQLDQSELENFFNGKIPSYEEALSLHIPKRLINEDLINRINKSADEENFAVTLLYGAGGEGKSTVLKQVAFALILQNGPKIQVIYREEETADLTALVQKIENRDEKFVIVSDDAQIIAKDIAKLAKRNAKPNNIQFLLASRTTHWKWESSADSDLGTYLVANYYKKEIGTIEPEDANKIVKAWEATNTLGKLNEEKTHEKRVKRLLEEAKLTVDKSGSGNSFFSSILWVRENKTLDSRVKDILNGLKEKPSLNGKTLYYYFNYIIALHGDGFPYLTKMILQEALGCDETTLSKEVTEPLEGETAILQKGDLILARHGVFAQRAKEVLRSQVDFKKIIGELTIAEHKLQRNHQILDTEHNAWLDLPNKYFKVIKPNQPETALAIVEAIAKDETLRDSIHISKWANLLRQWGVKLKDDGKSELADTKFNQADKIYTDNFDVIEPNRAYLTDWGVLQGIIGRTYFNVWLAATSLSDGFSETQSLVTPIALRLVALAAALSKSYTKALDNNSQSLIFKKATEGVVKLAFDERAEKKNLDHPSINTYRKFALDGRGLGLSLREVGSSEDVIENIEISDKTFGDILNGIELAWQLCEVDYDGLPETLPKPSDLQYNKLKKIFGIITEVNQDDEQSEETVEYQSQKFPFVYDSDDVTIWDNDGYKVDLSPEILKVLIFFFESEGQGVKTQLTFDEVAEIYCGQSIDDEQRAKEEANNFARTLRRQLKEKYGVENKDEIIKSWRGNGFQIGDNLRQGKKKYIDAEDRYNIPLNEAIDYGESDRTLTSKKSTSD